MADKIIGSLADGFDSDPESQAIVDAELRQRMDSLDDGTAELVEYADVQRDTQQAARSFEERKNRG